MNNQQIDLDRQFAEDLERAEALSLESLALEQFKSKKLSEQSVRNETKTPKVSLLRTSSMNESHKSTSCSSIRSRPTHSVKGNAGIWLVPPPLSVNNRTQRRQDTPDLISFASPPHTPSNVQKYEINEFIPNVTRHEAYNVRSVRENILDSTSSTTSVQSRDVSRNNCFQRLHNKSTDQELFTYLNNRVQQKLTDSDNMSRSFSANDIQSNLIDLTFGADDKFVKVSVLQEFDPILMNSDCSSYSNGSISSTALNAKDDCHSEYESVYDEYYPYDFITTGASSTLSDPLYSAVLRNDTSYKATSSIPQRVAYLSEFYTNSNKINLMDSICPTDNTCVQNQDPDLKAFYKMCYSVRNKYVHNQPDTNMGLVISPMVKYTYSTEISIKLCIKPGFNNVESDRSINLTCDISTSVEHLTLQLVYDLELSISDKYTLKLWNCNEYLIPTSLLSDYEYIHNCIKLDEDVKLTLVPDSLIDRSLLRTSQDDIKAQNLTFDDIIPSEIGPSSISYQHFLILLETVESEMAKLELNALELEKGYDTSLASVQSVKVIQSVKCIVNFLGQLCTSNLIETVDELDKKCSYMTAGQSTYSYCEIINECCHKIRLALIDLTAMYTKISRANFSVKKTDTTQYSHQTKHLMDISDIVLIRIGGLFRINADWKHDSYVIVAQVYHGTRPVGQPVLSQISHKVDKNHWWPSRIPFNHWIQLDDVSINSLARESRLVLVLYGRLPENNDNNDSSSVPQYKQEELGWTGFQFFDYEGELIYGNMFLTIWPHEAGFQHTPAPSLQLNQFADYPVLEIECITPYKTKFPTISTNVTSDVMSGNFHNLDNQTQRQLLDICEQDMLSKIPTDIREVLWEKRHYLFSIPKALPKVLLAAHSWDFSMLPDLYGMLHSWKALQPIQALQLLLPTFPDIQVRKMAIKWIKCLNNDELIDYLPQLIIALRFETYETSTLAEFLLDTALKWPRFAHHLYWLLSHTLAEDIQPSHNSQKIKPIEFRYQRRLRILLNALLATCGDSLRTCLNNQQSLITHLDTIALNIKSCKDSHRTAILIKELCNVNLTMQRKIISLPLSLTWQVAGIEARSCSYFQSNTFPLKVNFTTPTGVIIPALYKVGDDLQQDVLTLQLVRLMDKLWLNNGLDLKMVSFICVPTGPKKGIIEMVSNAETLRKIQVEHGLTGSFKDKPIAEWLAKHNPCELDYERAVENFTASCAGYCVATYVLGICDRHNDNIMLKTSGHLFHIDFGKFLGDAQMFGNFKRDRAPFVLTSDMAYVINGGDRPSEKFHKFIDLCCQAFNIIRQNSDLFLYLFTLMASSNIETIKSESVAYLHEALLPGMSNAEAAAYFARLIESSLKSWFTQFNFFIHNLAQLKFSSDQSDNSLLSFVPKIYSMNSDGRLIHVQVASYQKRYDPDKYYVYILRVHRENMKGYMEIQRTYKEFCELHQKLCLFFPLAKLYSLSTWVHVGRSNIKQVAQKRYREISLFVTSLFCSADEIAHSNLVYTFFHPLLRDQNCQDVASRKIQDDSDMYPSKGIIKGQLKLSFQFCKGVFAVMVYHVRGLPLLSNGQEPSTYVKVYLLPDVTKTTKRKTKVVRKSCHPSFVEMLEYRMSMDIIAGRQLQATVWHYDALQENEFLGGVELDLDSFNLTDETMEWYPLCNLIRR